LSYAEFVRRAADFIGLDAELYAELYPMVSDLLAMARRVRETTPELFAGEATE
jgi:hypothetical protein